MEWIYIKWSRSWYTCPRDVWRRQRCIREGKFENGRTGIAFTTKYLYILIITELLYLSIEFKFYELEFIIPAPSGSNPFTLLRSGRRPSRRRRQCTPTRGSLAWLLKGVQTKLVLRALHRWPEKEERGYKLEFWKILTSLLVTRMMKQHTEVPRYKATEKLRSPGGTR